MELPQELLVLAAQQAGVLSRAQLLGAGLSKAQIRRELGSRWRVLLPGVVLTNAALASPDQRLMAALLCAGPDSWIAGATAAAWHGMPGVPSFDQARTVHVLVPGTRKPRDVSWVSIRRTHLVEERLFQRGALRIGSRARSVVDAAASAPTVDDARAIIIGSLQRRLVRADDVAHWIEARRPNGRRLLRQALHEAMAGAWSVPEADLLHLVGTSRVLPEAMANPELRDTHGKLLTTPDVWFDDVAMAVMVHSKRYHANDLDWEATVEGDTDLAVVRVAVVGVTPASIARDPRRVLQRIERTYEEVRASGFRPAVRATPRSVSIWRGA